MSSTTAAQARTFAICLGSGTTAEGTASETTLLRANLATEIAKNDSSVSVILSGDGRKAKDEKVRATFKTEAVVMAEILAEAGISPDRLLKEDESVDTIGNAVLSAVRFLDDQTPGRLLVITSPFHMERAILSLKGVLDPAWKLVEKPCGIASDDAVRGANEAGGVAWTKAFFEGLNPGDLPAAVNRLRTKGKPLYHDLPRLVEYCNRIAAQTKPGEV